MSGEPVKRASCLIPGRTHVGAAARQAAIRLLVGNILAGVDALLQEARASGRPDSSDWAIRLGEVTAQLSLAELTTAGQQLRAALKSLEYSTDLLGFQNLQRQEQMQQVAIAIE